MIEKWRVEMKTYIFDRVSNIFYDSIRQAERDTGKTLAQLSRDRRIKLLTNEDVSVAFAKYFGEEDSNVVQKVRRKAERTPRQTT
jgi:hypothetical protein